MSGPSAGASLMDNTLPLVYFRRGPGDDMLGFESIGSATLIAYDGEPVLTTDAWINDDAYFGSWTHDYAIPPAQMDAIKRAKYHWFSHGHPDHLNMTSLPMLTGGQILLSDHYGGRVRKDLESQ